MHLVYARFRNSMQSPVKLTIDCKKMLMLTIDKQKNLPSPMDGYPIVKHLSQRENFFVQ